MTDFSAPPERIFAGTVGKGHGLDGSFYVVSAVPDLLVKGAELWVGAEAEVRTIDRRAGTDEKPIVRLSGSRSRNDADSFRGLTLQASNAGAPELGEGEYWAHQVVGCVVTAKVGGRTLGEVVEMMALPSCEVLVVRKAAAAAAPEPDAGEGGDGAPAKERRDDLLIPMVKDAIVEIDPAGRRIVVDAEFLALDDA
ncbi:MAG: ribosome maturation factor RimM [Solirubrobacteraceae bacterium]|nr:ribosome maturation factor RimM [Solirubrobacteraceae bacterium]